MENVMDKDTILTINWAIFFFLILFSITVGIFGQLWLCGGTALFALGFINYSEHKYHSS